MADKVWRRGPSGHKVGHNKAGHKADTWRTSFGGAGSKGRLKRCTHGEHMADKVWRRGQSGKADTSGHMADKLQGRGQTYRGQLFFPKREPQSKLFGGKKI